MQTLALLLSDVLPVEFELSASALAPLATGEYVNFESPAVDPIAVSAGGSQLFVANTPNNSLVVINTVVGTTLNGVARNPVTEDLFVSNLEPLNLVRMGENLNGHFIDHMIEIVSGYAMIGATVTPVDLHAGIPNFNDTSRENPVAKANSLAHPQNVAFHDNGLWAAVASLGMDRIGILNGITAQVMGRVDVPAGPRGLAIDSATNTLYVWSRNATTVSAVDVTAPSQPVVTEQLALFNPEPDFIRDNRRFHYSTRFSRNGAHSCDSYHMTGGFGMIHDGREDREDNQHPLQTFLDEFFPEQITGIGPQEQLDMIAALNAFPSNVMNVVGWEIPISPPPVPAVILGKIDTIIAQYDKTPSHCDVIIKGWFGSVQSGFLLTDSGTNGVPAIYTSDLGIELTLDDILNRMGQADSLIVSAVPPGSGKRIGIDQDTDGLLDGNDPMPQHDNTGDFNIDGDVDLSDYAALQRCFTGPGGVVTGLADCILGDADKDGDVDLIDYAAIEKLIVGPQP